MVGKSFRVMQSVCQLYLLSNFLLPPRYAQGKVLALAAAAIGLGIAMAGTFGVGCRARLNA